MPYGIDKDIGGDSPENIKWMENCVAKVMKTHKDKGTAIAICKATLKKSKGNHDKANFYLIEAEKNGDILQALRIKDV